MLSSQADEKSGYCGASGPLIANYWRNKRDGAWPSEEWIPPYDMAQDLLFVGIGGRDKSGGRKFGFVPIKFHGRGW